MYTRKRSKTKRVTPKASHRYAVIDEADLAAGCARRKAEAFFPLVSSTYTESFPDDVYVFFLTTLVYRIVPMLTFEFEHEELLREVHNAPPDHIVCIYVIRSSIYFEGHINCLTALCLVTTVALMRKFR